MSGERKRFYQGIADFWPDVNGEPYALYDLYRLEQNTVHEIRQATERLGEIFFKTAHLLRALDDRSLLALGLPEETLRFVRIPSQCFETVIGRFDFAMTHDGPKLLEFNADTPTFIKECFLVNGKVCESFGANDPNAGEEWQLGHAIRTAVEASARSLGLPHPPLVVFTAHESNREDFLTSKYLLEVSGLPAELVPLHELRINPYGVYTRSGRKIDILYRQTYPIEHLVYDEEETSGTKVGEMLLQLAVEKKVALLNPPSAFLLQSKAVQALIWGLAQERSQAFFTEQEVRMIRRYMLPTYLEPDAFAGRKHVKKPVFGREGDSVSIYDERQTLIEQDRQQQYFDAAPVYQAFVELQKGLVKTDEGEREMYLLLGSFFVGGKASAIAYRASETAITGNLSYFLPVGLLH